jgi:hypothetical protein
MMHMENLGVAGPQSVKRLTKQDAELFGRAFLLRIRSRLNHLKSGVFSLNHLIKRSFAFPSTRAQSHKRCIQGDTSQPGGKA